MKYILSDYYQNCLVQVPVDYNNERTFFCEVIILILKTFAIHSKNTTFRWCEKESRENKSSWLDSTDYVAKNIEKKKCWTDMGSVTIRKGIAVMVKSSGGGANVSHSVSDSLKQLKNATDFLTYLKARFQDSSARTFTMLRTPTLLLIRNQLTMTTTSLESCGCKNCYCSDDQKKESTIW